MSHPDPQQHQTRAEQALALYEAIEQIAADQDDPRWVQAALILSQLQEFGPQPDSDDRSPFTASGGFGHRTGGASAMASDREYDGYAE